MNKPRMLIAEDDRELAFALQCRCGRLGMDVTSVADGLAAVNLAHQLHPEFICLDVNMPAGNGLAVCELLIGDPAFQDTSFLVLTGNPTDEVVRRCHRYGAFYVPKCDDVWGRIEPLLCELMNQLTTTSMGVAGREHVNR